jgi:acyl carrier protein|tara:strand:- start:1325 stop:1567 length:243 start_codon:yes stop_codon:yes gene_type:complete
MNFLDKVIAHIAEVLAVEPKQLNEETGVGDIPGWDSLAHIRLILSLEETFKITIDIEDAVEMETIEDIVDLLEEKTAVNR